MSRHKNDFYVTPQGLTLALLDTVPISGFIFECCAGNGSMAKLLPGFVVTNDIDAVRNTDHHFDATDGRNWIGHDVDWVVTNPPFSQAHEIITHALKHARVGVAMLLRITYLEPTFKRGGWLDEHSHLMSHMIIFGSPRPGFTAKGTDSATTVWLVWQHNHTGGTQIKFHTDWKDMRHESK